MAVIETTITIAAEINPASTAAVPITNAPTMDIADPIALGILNPASLNISNVISMITASTNAGNGTPSRWAAKLINSAGGIISW